MQATDGLFWITLSCALALAIVQVDALIGGESMEPLMPVFDSKTQNITAVAGGNVNLPCSIENKGDNKVIWMNPTVTLISQDDSRYIDDSRMSVEHPKIGEWNLLIREVRYNDSGVYMCQINTKPVRIKRIYLFVKVAPEIIDSWTSPSSTMRVKEGSTIELVCNATGVPTPVVTWYKQADLLMDNNGDRTLEGEVLLLRNISRYCEGEYECNAQNGVPPFASKTFVVAVEFPPEVRLHTSRMGQAVGKETILECKVSASPHATITWRKNGTEIPFERQKFWQDLYGEEKHEKTLMLNIINIEKSDFGYYTCHASNQLGQDSETMLLYEYFKAEKRLTTTTLPPSAITTKVVNHFSKVDFITPPHWVDHKGDSHFGGSGYYTDRNAASLPSSSQYNWTQIVNACIILFIHMTGLYG